MATGKPAGIGLNGRLAVFASPEAASWTGAKRREPRRPWQNQETSRRKFPPKKALSFPARPTMLLIPPAKTPVELCSWCFTPGLYRPGVFFACGGKRAPAPCPARGPGLKSESRARRSRAGRPGHILPGPAATVPADAISPRRRAAKLWPCVAPPGHVFLTILFLSQRPRVFGSG